MPVDRRDMERFVQRLHQFRADDVVPFTVYLGQGYTTTDLHMMKLALETLATAAGRVIKSMGKNNT